jgi:hypothetical protein
MGQLTVFCTPACDEVIDGGRSLGPSPVFKVSVPVGPHRITLVSTDPPVRKVVSVAVGEEEVAVVREAMGGVGGERSTGPEASLGTAAVPDPSCGGG